jgi:hypothetical protein
MGFFKFCVRGPFYYVKSILNYTYIYNKLLSFERLKYCTKKSGNQVGIRASP